MRSGLEVKLIVETQDEANTVFRSVLVLEVSEAVNEVMSQGTTADACIDELY